MEYDYKYFKDLNESSTRAYDYDKISSSDASRIEERQGEFRAKMSVLKEIRDLPPGDLTDEKRTIRDALLSDVKAIVDELDKFPKCKNDSDGPDFDDGDHDSNQRQGKGYLIRSAREKKDFRTLFGAQPLNEYRWEDKDIDFFSAVFSGRFHPDLQTRSMIEGVQSEGGFLLPTQVTEGIHNVSLENELIMPRATVIPCKTNSLEIPAADIGDHSSSLFGGFTASYKAEVATLSQANPKFRKISFALKKLTGFLRFSNELFSDIPGGGDQITQICGKGLAWYRDKAFLKGTGAGEPLGILNSDCLITVEKETGQSADTICYANLTKMMSRMFAGSFANSVWICHQTTIPQLLSLSIAIGTGGSFVPVMSQKDGKFTMLTRPVIFSEKNEVLGNAGDIILADLSQYVIGLREEMRIDYSAHLYFNTDEHAARLIERHDGMPIWDESLTLEDGSTTVSPFVTLAAR